MGIENDSKESAQVQVDPNSNAQNTDSNSGAGTFPGEAQTNFASLLSVKIPPFWTNRPDLWFIQIETQFRLKGITASNTKFDYVVSSLLPETLEIVADILTNPPDTKRYEHLKKTLLSRSNDSDEKKLNTLLKVQVGDAKPSELYRQMQSLASANCLVNIQLLFKLWVNKLPQSVKAPIIAMEKKHSLEQLLEIADNIFDSMEKPEALSVNRQEEMSNNENIKLAHLDKRERERQDQTPPANRNKAEEIILLEKQGRCSQKTRGNPSGNLAQVTQTVGQNMTDISNIGNTSPTSQRINALALPPKKERGNSLPPSALPRPPRSLKPPRKIDYDRLSDSELKKHSETPPKESPQRIFELKTSSLKRSQYGPHEYSPGTNNFIKETLSFPKSDLAFKRKDYGAMDSTDTMKFGLPASTDFSKPDFTSTKKYQRLEDGPKPLKLLTDSNSLKRTFLPGSSRKINILAPNNCNLKQPRELLNSNGTQNCIPSPRGSPMHMKTDSSASHLTLRLHSKTPPKYLHFGGPSVPHVSLEPPTSSANSHSSHQIRLQPTQLKTSLPIPTSSASLPPKPAENKSTRRGPSISRSGENRYRIQF